MPSLNATVRQGIAQLVINEAGIGAKLKAYNGLAPGGVAAVSGANALLAVASASGVVGTASAAGVDINESAFSQVPTNHVAGTPTFVDLTTSGDVVVLRTRLGQPGEWTWSGGALVPGLPFSLVGLTLPVDNP